MNNYKNTTPLKERIEKSNMLLKKYFPGRVPVILQKYNNSDDMPELKQTKFLVPSEFTYSEFMLLIRNKFKILNETKALYLITETGSILSASDLMSSVYDCNKDPIDHFLYLFYCTENTFG
jgi:hypothetical protein